MASKNDGIISIIFWICGTMRYFGLSPFHLEYNVKHKICCARVTILDWLWFAIAITFYATIETYKVFLNIEKSSRDTIEFSALLLIEIWKSVIIIISIIMDMFNRKDIGKIVNKLSRFDEEVNYCLKIPNKQFTFYKR